MTISRRDLLRLVSAASATSVLPVGCGDDAAAPAGPSPSFHHGVASGDPTPDAVILWTRITPPTAVAPATEVRWEVSTTENFAALVRQGVFSTSAERDWTVKVDATGLRAGTAYYYRFRAGSSVSPVGRTKTAPTGSLAHARFGLCSCSSLAHGYFHTYRQLSRREDLDAVIHLGDYIYEYGSGQYGNVRAYEPPREIISLADYRTRYAQYRSDADLQAAHARHPFIAIWDDHEFADNAYTDGANKHMPAMDGPWADRKAAAARAYMEWMPIREQQDRNRIYRTLRYGDLLDLILLDTRIWGRQMQASDEMTAMLPDRQILGADQERWFFDQMTTSRARWKIVGQQVMMGQLSAAVGLIFGDQWDGYAAARTRFLTLLRSMRLTDVVVLTGDIHSSWAIELAENPADAAAYDPATGRGALAVEFVTPSITSPGLPAALSSALDSLLQMARYIKYADGDRHGYIILDVTPERTQAAWYYVEDVTSPTASTATFASAWSVAHGSSHLVRDMTPAT